MTNINLKLACEARLVGTNSPFVVVDVFNDKHWSFFSKVDGLFLYPASIEPCSPRRVCGFDVLTKITTLSIWDIAIRKGFFNLYNLAQIYEVCFQDMKNGKKLLIGGYEENIFFTVTKNFKPALVTISKDKDKLEMNSFSLTSSERVEYYDTGARIFF